MGEARSVGIHYPVPGVAIYGYADGSLRKTTNYCATPPFLVKEGKPEDGTIKNVWWEEHKRPWWVFWRRVRYTVWAKTEFGKLYGSKDEGITWDG